MMMSLILSWIHDIFQITIQSLFGYPWKHYICWYYHWRENVKQLRLTFRLHLTKKTILFIGRISFPYQVSFTRVKFLQEKDSHRGELFEKTTELYFSYLIHFFSLTHCKQAQVIKEKCQYKEKERRKQKNIDNTSSYV